MGLTDGVGPSAAGIFVFSIYETNIGFILKFVWVGMEGKFEILIFISWN